MGIKGTEAALHQHLTRIRTTAKLLATWKKNPRLRQLPSTRCLSRQRYRLRAIPPALLPHLGGSDGLSQSVLPASFNLWSIIVSSCRVASNLGILNQTNESQPAMQLYDKCKRSLDSQRWAVQGKANQRVVQSVTSRLFLRYNRYVYAHYELKIFILLFYCQKHKLKQYCSTSHQDE